WMESPMDQLEQILKVLADKNRMRIIKLLENKKLCVCEITFVLGIKQPSVSRHLKKLRESGIIQEEKNGYWKDYSLVKSDTPYTKLLRQNFRSWLNNDPVILKDRAKLKKADRNSICCQ
ncbi:MAG: metalloregulator ArsR/SmtB family transcription factor, partial [Candidatus Omnitrophica bacterium]|nr:metalloregulator ArsR/SmtB family transcription factor [Candidatus Omnitrophota bacterium]